MVCSAQLVGRSLLRSCPDGSRTMAHMTTVTSEDEAAALLTSVRNRPQKMSIPDVVSHVLDAGSAVAAWADMKGEAPTLFGEDPFAGAREEIRSWNSSWVSLLDKEYPARLKGVHDAPPFLFYRGSLEAVQRGGMSIVGTRRLSPAGQQRAQDAAAYLAELGIPIISGLAAGIDAVAHTTALSHGGLPVGVIATPIAGPYTPAPNRDLHEKVAESGVLISQFFPGIPVAKRNFIQRNATMSGLGDATIIIEASENSGTRAQARFAMGHGRPVILSKDVACTTTWGKNLANQYRNVYVVSSRDDLHQAIRDVKERTSINLSSLLEMAVGT